MKRNYIAPKLPTPQPPNPRISDFRKIISTTLKKYLDCSKTLGGEVALQAEQVKNAYHAELAYLTYVALNSEPKAEQRTALLKHLGEKVDKIGKIASAKWDSHQYNHLAAISVSIDALKWFCEDTSPVAFINRMSDLGQVYIESLLKKYQNKDKAQDAWVRSYLELMASLRDYVRDCYNKGMEWCRADITGKPKEPLPPAPAHRTNMHYRRHSPSTSMMTLSNSQLYAAFTKMSVGNNDKKPEPSKQLTYSDESDSEESSEKSIEENVVSVPQEPKRFTINKSIGATPSKPNRYNLLANINKKTTKQEDSPVKPAKAKKTVTANSRDTEKNIAVNWKKPTGPQIHAGVPGMKKNPPPSSPESFSRARGLTFIRSSVRREIAGEQVPTSSSASSSERLPVRANVRPKPPVKIPAAQAVARGKQASTARKVSIAGTPASLASHDSSYTSELLRTTPRSNVGSFTAERFALSTSNTSPAFKGAVTSSKRAESTYSRYNTPDYGSTATAYRTSAPYYGRRNAIVGGLGLGHDGSFRLQPSAAQQSAASLLKSNVTAAPKPRSPMQPSSTKQAASTTTRRTNTRINSIHSTVGQAEQLRHNIDNMPSSSSANNAPPRRNNPSTNSRGTVRGRFRQL